MERSEVDRKYLWKTEDIFPSDEAWEKAYAEVESMLDFSAFEGKLGDITQYIAYNQREEEVGRKIERVYLYAHMRHDEDSRIAKYTAMQSRAMSLYVRLSAALAFVEPELSALDEQVLRGYMEDPRLKDRDYFLRSLIKGKKHILSAAEEKLLGAERYIRSSATFSG